MLEIVVILALLPMAIVVAGYLIVLAFQIAIVAGPVIVVIVMMAVAVHHYTTF